MSEEIKEISKVDKQLLDKIENILASELSSNEYDKFYNYFNEIRKPNILIDIKDVESIKDYITNLQKENKQLKKSRDFHLRFNQSLMRRVDFYQSRNKKAIEYIEKYLQEHIIDDLPDEESKFELENGTPIPNAKEILLNILQGGDE